MTNLLKAALTKEIEKRFAYAEQVPLLAISTLLDPRFKKNYFKNVLNCSSTVETINNLIIDTASIIQETEVSPKHRNVIADGNKF